MGQRLGNAPRNLVWPHSQPCFEQRFGLETSQGQSLQSALTFLIWGSFCFPVTSLKPEPQHFIHKKPTGVYIISLYPHHATTFLTRLFLGSQATTEWSSLDSLKMPRESTLFHQFSLRFLFPSLTVLCWGKEHRNSKSTLFGPLNILLNYMYPVLRGLFSKRRVPVFSLCPEKPSWSLTISISTPQTSSLSLFSGCSEQYCHQQPADSPSEDVTHCSHFFSQGLADPNISFAFLWKCLPAEQSFTCTEMPRALSVSGIIKVPCRISLSSPLCPTGSERAPGCSLWSFHKFPLSDHQNNFLPRSTFQRISE